MMNPARSRAYRSSNVFEERDDIVVCALLDLEDLWDRKARLLSNFGCVFFRDLAKIGHRLGSEQFNLEANLEFALVGPNVAHLRPRITIDHAAR